MKLEGKKQILPTYFFIYFGANFLNFIPCDKHLSLSVGILTFKIWVPEVAISFPRDHDYTCIRIFNYMTLPQDSFGCSAQYVSTFLFFPAFSNPIFSYLFPSNFSQHGRIRHQPNGYQLLVNAPRCAGSRPMLTFF